MTPYEALKILDEARLSDEKTRISSNTLVIIISKIGYDDCSKILIKWSTYSKVANLEGPAVLIIPGTLHFAEREYIMEVLTKIE